METSSKVSSSEREIVLNGKSTVFKPRITVLGTVTANYSELGGRIPIPAPADLGIHSGQLSPCPGSAHCAEMRFISSDPSSTFQALVNLIGQDRSAHVVEQTTDYLHAEVSSAFFGFVDDLELLMDPTGVQSRSISRLGESDLGVNASRLADLQAHLKH